MGKFKKKIIDKAVFFDRDGVINIPVIIKNKPHPPKNLKNLFVYKQFKNCILKIKKNGFKTFIITNQPDYQRGLVKKKDIMQINNFLKKKFKLNKVYVCYDSSNKSFFKKPNPGMLIQAKKEFNLNLKKSYLIGDTYKDIIAGNKVGCTTILLKKKYNNNYKKLPDYYVANLNSATSKIINEK